MPRESAGLDTLTIDGITVSNPFKSRYENFIGNRWVAPLDGRYSDNPTPIDGRLLCQVPCSGSKDIDLALDAAHAAQRDWSQRSPARRARLLHRIADRIEQERELLAVAETLDNGKPIRETRHADIPLAADHFRYFAACLRTDEGRISPLDAQTQAHHLMEPLGVVGQIIPWNFPLLMAAWKLAPALAAGNTVVLKPAEQTPASILVLMDLLTDILPPGTVNIVNGSGPEAGRALAESPRIAQLSFTGASATGRLILQYAAQQLTPVTLELGGKSPNLFFEDVMAADDGYLDKALEGFAMFALNQGEICASPSRALVHSSIYDAFMERALARVKTIRLGNPLDPATMVGALTSSTQMHKVLSYIELGKQEGARCLTGGQQHLAQGDRAAGCYVEPTVFSGHNGMRIFREEIFGPVLCVCPFRTEEEALTLANDSAYGLGAGVWTRDGSRAFRMGQGLRAGRIWINCYHRYPAHAAFGGYGQSGFGREGHKSTLDQYRQTKSLLVSHSQRATGLF